MKGSGTIRLRNQDGTLYKDIALTSEWKRHEFSFNGSVTNFQLLQYSGSSDFEIWGAQLEAGNYPTSYIPTYGSSVTRSTEVGDTTRLSNIMNVDQWTYFVEFEETGKGTSSQRIIGDSANNINLYLGSDLNFRFYYRIKGVYITDDTGLKIVSRYDGTQFSEFHDGAEVTYNSQSRLQTGDVDFDIQPRTDANTSARIKQIVIFPTALTDSECIELTINGLKEDLITAYKTRATTLEAGAGDRLDTYLQQLEDFIIV
jgi:hypothetical protein